MKVTAAGPWMADYGRIFKNDNGDEAVCCGFHHGSQGTFTRLILCKEPYTVLDCEFWTSNTPWNTDTTWFAVDLWLSTEDRNSLYTKSNAKLPQIKLIREIPEGGSCSFEVDGQWYTTLSDTVRFFNGTGKRYTGTSRELIQDLIKLGYNTTRHGNVINLTPPDWR